MKRILVCVLSCGCLDAEIELPPAIEVLGVSPAADVAEDSPVTVAFSGPVRRGASWPITVSSSAGPVPIEIDASDASVSIAPAPRWPPGESLTIAIERGLRDEHGRPIAPAMLTFTTRARPIRDQPAIVRTPTPGTIAPMNLEWIALALGAPDFEPKAALVSEHQNIGLVRDRSLDGVGLFRVPAHEGPCRPLCPGERYHVEVEGWRTGEGPLGEIVTATITDDTPPTIIASKVVFRGGQPWVEICADEPILIRGEARSDQGGIVPFRAVPVAAERALAVPEIPLDSASPHHLVFEAVDVAGNRAPLIEIPLVTPPAIAIAISEIVASPLRDWNDSEGGDVPFDPFPGVGTVSEADEWVELVNLSEAPIDLTSSGIELRTIDGTPSVTPLAGAPGRYFGDGGSVTSWWPGEALVVRARGAMSSQSLIVEVAAADQIFDRVVIGSETGADHAGGSPPNVHYESIARTETGAFAWCVPTPGDPLPARDCGY